jgi:hypothetical protein
VSFGPAADQLDRVSALPLASESEICTNEFQQDAVIWKIKAEGTDRPFELPPRLVDAS